MRECSICEKVKEMRAKALFSKFHFWDTTKTNNAGKLSAPFVMTRGGFRHGQSGQLPRAAKF